MTSPPKNSSVASLTADRPGSASSLGASGGRSRPTSMVFSSPTVIHLKFLISWFFMVVLLVPVLLLFVSETDGSIRVGLLHPTILIHLMCINIYVKQTMCSACSKAVYPLEMITINSNTMHKVYIDR